MFHPHTVTGITYLMESNIMKKYIPYILILAAFLAGMFLGSSNDSKLLQDKWEKERKVILESLLEKQVREATLIKAGEATEQKRVNDSLYYARQLESNKQAYLALKKKYNEINLNRATVPELDSIVARLYPD